MISGLLNIFVKDMGKRNGLNVNNVISYFWFFFKHPKCDENFEKSHLIRVELFKSFEKKIWCHICTFGQNLLQKGVGLLLLYQQYFSLSPVTSNLLPVTSYQLPVTSYCYCYCNCYCNCYCYCCCHHYYDYSYK